MDKVTEYKNFDQSTKDKKGGDMKYRKKPVIVEAIPWDGKFYPDNPDVKDFHYFIVPSDWDKDCPQCHQPIKEHGSIKTLEGSHIVCPGDMIITGVKGEKYPCKPDVFKQTYEPVKE